LKTIAALFDCDGTIYSAQYGREMMNYCSDNGRGMLARLYYASLFPGFVLRKIKLISDETFHRPVISRLAWLAKGMTIDEFQKASEHVLNDHLIPEERPEVVSKLREHQAKGHAILLVSGMPIPSLEMLGAHYKVTGVVGTKLEVKDGHYTGRSLPPPMTGHAKDKYSREFFSDNNIDVDWEASYAYADSFTDLGLFGLVGNPKVVCPDKKLLGLAQSKNWEIIGKPKE